MCEPTVNDRRHELSRMTKGDLARLHAGNGGQMGISVYLQWRKDELVAAVLEDEGLDPWSA